MGLTSFFRGFGKKAPGTALVKYVSPAAEELIDTARATSAVNNYLKRKTTRGVIEGGVGGGLLGAGAGYAQAKAHEAEGGKPAVGAIVGGVIGGFGGATLGATIRSGLAARRAQAAARGYNESSQRVFAKTPSGRYATSPHVEEHLFSDPSVRKRVLDDSFRVIKSDGSQSFAGRQTPVSFYSASEKEKALEELVNSAKRSQVGLNFNMDRFMDGFMGIRNAKPQIKNKVYEELVKQMERGSASGQVSSLIQNLRSEGVTGSKEFVKRYHPDKNTNAPKAIKDNFSAILDHLRHQEKGHSTAENVFSGFLEKQKEHIRNANQHIRGLK